jgi:hypothetical protein
MTQAPDPIDELLALPPPEFVSARNRLSAALRKTDPTRAAAIKAMAKPSASVWATNQVARRAPDRLTRYLEASDALARAQSSGGGSDQGRRGYQAALAAQREALDQAVTAAREALTAAKLGAPRAVLDKITNDLRWAVLSEDLRGDLVAGRLTKDLEPPDFAALAARMPVTGAGAPRDKPAGRSTAKLTLVPNEPSATTRVRVRAEQSRKLEALAARHDGAQEQVDIGRQALADAAEARAEAEHAVSTLRRELAAAERRLSQAQRAHESAEKDLETREERLAQVAAERKRAERDAR